MDDSIEANPWISLFGKQWSQPSAEVKNAPPALAGGIRPVLVDPSKVASLCPIFFRAEPLPEVGRERLDG
jgi:hypothetical protein